MSSYRRFIILTLFTLSFILDLLFLAIRNTTLVLSIEIFVCHVQRVLHLTKKFLRPYRELAGKQTCFDESRSTYSNLAKLCSCYAFYDINKPRKFRDNSYISDRYLMSGSFDAMSNVMVRSILSVLLHTLSIHSYLY